MPQMERSALAEAQNVTITVIIGPTWIPPHRLWLFHTVSHLVASSFADQLHSPLCTWKTLFNIILIYLFYSFNNNLMCVYVGVWVLTCYDMCVRVMRQLLGVSSFLPPCRILLGIHLRFPGFVGCLFTHLGILPLFTLT